MAQNGSHEVEIMAFLSPEVEIIVFFMALALK